MKRKAGALLLIALLAACAQVREITGGDKDEDGPLLKSAQPPNYSTHFSGDRIVLHFNERVQVERVRERLLISPPLDEVPTVRIVRAYDVEIELNAPLRANTTYTFSMGEVVKDLTEGNFAAGMDYVLSTGDALDSLLLAGDVTHAFSGEAQKDVLVMLYPASDTADFKQSRPTYATRTNAEGHFLLQHLRGGSYRVRALRDQNANYRYDLPNEEIAFVEQAVDAKLIDSTYTPVVLRLFQETSPVQSVREAIVEADGAWRIVFSRPAESIALRDLERNGGTLAWEPEWSATRDTVLLWPSDTTALGDGRYVIDTEEGPLDTLRYRAIKKMPYYTGLITYMREEATGLEMHIEARRPIASFDRERFVLEQDSTAVPFALERDSVDRRHLVLRPELAPGANATLTILPKAVRDIYAGHNDTLRIAMGRAAEQRTGTLRVTVEMPAAPSGTLLLQLLDGQGHVVREAPVNAGTPVNWERITPGNHTLRMIDDANGNGRWDTGQWAVGLQPETVWHHREVLNVRAAWDLGIVWKVGAP